MVTIRGLGKRFDTLAVLDNVNLTIGDKEIVALVGRSGSGKTTLLNCIAGFVAPNAGEVDTSGARIGCVFQEDRLLPWRTVAENIALVRDIPNNDEVRMLIDSVGLAGFENYYPDALSGGMRQRCSIARAYHYRSDVLLLDEPFKSLDHNLRFAMLATLMRLHRERPNAILFITHDIDEALAVAARIAVMAQTPATIVHEYDLGSVDAPRDTETADLRAIKNDIIQRLC